MKKASVIAMVAVVAALVFGFAPRSVSAQEKAATKAEKAPAQLRWHGTITRISADGGVLTVRKGNIEKAVHLTADTKFTKTEGKKAVNIDKGDIKEGDDVICLGKADEKKEFVAERVDKRLPK